MLGCLGLILDHVGIVGYAGPMLTPMLGSCLVGFFQATLDFELRWLILAWQCIWTQPTMGLTGSVGTVQGIDVVLHHEGHAARRRYILKVLWLL